MQRYESEKQKAGALKAAVCLVGLSGPFKTCGVFVRAQVLVGNVVLFC